MLFFITGVPGSGKSYYLVHYAYSNKSKYTFIYHNVAGFKLFNNFNFKDFFAFCEELYKIYLENESDLQKDDILLSAVKKHQYYKSLIIIDECHNYFSNYKKSLNWFLSYHRHLHIDLILSTQNLQLVNYRYRNFSEYFIRSVSSSLRFLTHKFQYKKFSDATFRSDTCYDTFSLPMRQEIFSLYQSGDKIKGQKIFYKYYLYFFLALGLVFLLFFVFRRSMSPPQQQKPHKQIQVQKVQDQQQKPHKEVRDKQKLLNRDILTLCSGSVSSAFSSTSFSSVFLPYLLQNYAKVLRVRSDVYGCKRYYINVLDSVSYLSYIKNSLPEKSSDKPTFSFSPFDSVASVPSRAVPRGDHER